MAHRKRITCCRSTPRCPSCPVHELRRGQGKRGKKAGERQRTDAPRGNGRGAPPGAGPAT